MSDSETDEEERPRKGLDPDEDAEERPRHRLDPDRAAEAASRRAARRPPPPVIDTRRYQRVIGLIGLTLVVVISVAFLSSNHGQGTAGIPKGDRLHYFAAPLATSTLNGDANLHPPCTPTRHDPRALNLCLLAKQGPVVLGFFVTGSGGCKGMVDALQTVSKQFSPGQVQFAAVAVRASHSDAASAVRQQHWTIPVAYDADGAVGAEYGVEVCPIVELAQRGGRVKERLIGERWNDPAVLAAHVRALLRQAPGR
ncbi:MAG: TlpA family protein disulfide reductase [Solirubrobacteraceae bacterium]